VASLARRAAGRNGGKSRVGTGVKRLEAVATAAVVAAKRKGGICSLRMTEEGRGGEGGWIEHDGSI